MICTRKAGKHDWSSGKQAWHPRPRVTVTSAAGAIAWMRWLPVLNGPWFAVRRAPCVYLAFDFKSVFRTTHLGNCMGRITDPGVA